MRFPQSLLTNPFALLALLLGLTIVGETLLVNYLDNRTVPRITPGVFTNGFVAASPLPDGMQRLVRDDARSNDWFGAAVALDGSAAFVSSPCQPVDGGRSSGAVHLFERGPRGDWHTAHEFTRPELTDGAMFGVTLAADAGRVLIGACPNETQHGDAPVAYLYQRDNSDWHAVPLTMGDEGTLSLKSVAIALDDDTAIVGQIARDAATGRLSSRTCVFRSQPNGDWTRIATLAEDKSNAPPQSNFGAAIALSGKQAIVGAPLQTTDGGTTGAVHIFEEQADGEWRRTSLLVADDGQSADCFGTSVAISGDTAIVGAMANDAAGMNAGAAYVFRRITNGKWSQVARLTPNDLHDWSCFGMAVALDGNLAVISAPGTSDGAGTIYAYRLDESAVTQLARFTLPSATPRSGFGQSVAINGTSLLAGAPWADTPTQDNTGDAFALELQGPSQTALSRVHRARPIFARQ